MARIKLYKSKVWMTIQYQRNNLSAEEIAEICSVNVKTIYRYLKDYGLIRKK